ncbi:hypothetical protein HCJ66_13215 [Listeria sp. FSL L7-1582]|uniref:hypothetical protein n=1 Tax=Listeria portnoyi TaxID=2713504 RepID=UPI00164D2165|nr:hypothetical protein [Listeria portnoyi]MBC6310494.1 hypothetical protein [Listeria portnoyi]
METEDIKFSAYTVRTPLLRTKENTQIPDVLMENTIRSLFKKVINSSDEERAFTAKNKKYAELSKLLKVNGEDVIEGYFITTTFGEVGQVYNTKTQEVTHDITREEGDKKNVYFYFNLKTGLLLVQEDESNVLTKDTLQKYFRLRQNLVKDLITKFNSSQSEYHLPPNSPLMLLEIVQPKDFLSEVRRCTTVKHITLEYSILNSDAKFISAINEYSTSNGLNDLGKISVKLENSNYGEYLHGYVPFLEYIVNNDEVEIAVYGSIGGVNRTIRKDGSKNTLFYHAKDVEILGDGNLRFEELLGEMHRTNHTEKIYKPFNSSDQKKIYQFTL